VAKRAAARTAATAATVVTAVARSAIPKSVRHVATFSQGVLANGSPALPLLLLQRLGPTERRVLVLLLLYPPRRLVCVGHPILFGQLYGAERGVL
jgi:hypothetical protein